MKKYYDKELPVAVHVYYGERRAGVTYREIEKLKKENNKLNEELNYFKNPSNYFRFANKAVINDYDNLQQRIKELEEENKKVHKELDYANNDNIYLISKIDKAIEYINENVIQNDISNQDYQYKYEKLLKILKGE